MASWLITGCSRGIGLELVRQLAADTFTDKIIATARGAPSKELEALAHASKKIHIVKLDTLSIDEAKAAAAEVAKIVPNGLDVLVNNAGITMIHSSLTEVSSTDINKVFNTNVGGVQNVTVAFLPLLRKGSVRKIINMSSLLGSVAANTQYEFPNPIYRISKSALNALSVLWAKELSSEGFIIIPISPGWLKTDMGGTDAPLTVEEGVKGVLKLVGNATEKDNGMFYSYDGTKLPW